MSAEQQGRLALYWRLVRPFTLLAPAVGMVSAGVMALGAAGGASLGGWTPLRLAAGAALAVLLNAASNSLNQIFDLEADRINKPDRPLPSRALSTGEAWVCVVLCGAAAVGLAALLGWECFVVVVLGAAAVSAYSVPPLRTKRHWLLSNLTIALARGVLLIAAGWAVTGHVFGGRDWGQAWLVGGLFGLFVLGAASTKDFGDIPGDRAAGCVTLPIRFGVRRATTLMVPSLVLPFLLLVVVVQLGWLSARPCVATVLGLALAVWGGYVAYLLRRRPEELALENHPSWVHMYLMLMTFQVGLAAAYVL